MKACFKRGTEKPLSEFYRHSRMADGHLNKCKDCTRSDVAKHRSDHIDSVRAYDRQRAKLPHRKKHITENTKSFRSNNPEKYKAHSIVGFAIKSGRLIKPESCQSCGCDGIIHGHHDDYSKPLEVMWLCVPCHAARHQQLKLSKAA